MKITIEKGESLWDALQRENIAVDRPCGGNGSCGGCTVDVEKFGLVKSCKFRLAGTYEVTVKKERTFKTIGILKADGIKGQDKEDYLKIAVDIGTTTVALYANYNGKVYERSFTNPQRRFGADVMSRIKNSMADVETNAAFKDKFMAMSADDRKEVPVGDNQQEMFTDMSERLDALVSDILMQVQLDNNCLLEGAYIAMAANTTMLHLFNGWTVLGMAAEPFTPVSLDLEELDGYLLDISELEGKDTTQSDEARFHKIHIDQLPGASTFVGADIVSGIYAVDMAKSDEISLLIDLGTNGEMAIGNSEKILLASTAAGPAFEGSSLAMEVHGSGVIACLAAMLDKGIIDENGLLSEEYFERGFPARTLPNMADKVSSEDFLISQDHIREIQMAKSAIRSGIEILLTEYKITADMVDKVYLAGGMGYYLDPYDAVRIGLLPEAFLGKTVSCGNSSLWGAYRYLSADMEDEAKALKDIVDRSEEVRLANHKDFEDLYINNMQFE